MRRFFIPATQISRNQAVLRGTEFHHLRHVLRLAVGDPVLLTDDLKREHSGVITHLSASAATVTITDTTAGSASALSLTLAQGLLKGQKMDLVIEKATELGVQQVAPFTSTFTVAQIPSERQSDRVARWTRIARSAAKQSGSNTPRIDPPQSFTDLLTTIPSRVVTILFYEKETPYTLKAFAREHPQLSSLCIIVGSEGGFSPEEVTAARSAGAHIVGLGTPTLRAETAGIVAAALCQFLWNR
jgi:16S rRNA (uracil1498-N3)-methyltransferase